MRVAYVCADLGVPVFGSKGCSIHVQEIVRSFLKRGDQIELFVARTGGSLPQEFSECGVHGFAPKSSESTASREAAAQEVATRIGDALELHGPFDLVYERHSLWSAAGPRYANQRGIPCILEINAPLIAEQLKHRELHDTALAFTLSQLAFTHASSLAVVSNEVADAIIQDFDIDRQKLHVVPNGVDANRFSPNVPAQLPSDEFTIGFVGSLKPWHGVETLLEAYSLVQRECEHSRLLIVGDGPMASQLRHTHCSRGSMIADNVHWIGSVEPNLVPGYITSMHVAIAPYPNLEDFYFSPLKVYEYMACGVTTVASDIGQLKSIINHGVDGFLYDPSSTEELASTLLDLGRQAAVCREVGMRARMRAVEDFSWDQVLQRSLATIDLQVSHVGVECVLDSKGGPCS